MARIASIRQYIVPLILLAVLAVLPGLGASFVAVGADVTDQNGASTAKNQKDPVGAYTFTLPDGWQAAPSDDGGTRFTNPVNGMDFEIITSPGNGHAASDAMRDAVSSFSHQRGYREGHVKDQDLTIGGEPAKGLRFYSDSSDVNQVSTVAVVAVYKGTTYLLRFRVGQDQEKTTGPTIVAILNSWQFT
jgi:hypothetical protein